MAAYNAGEARLREAIANQNTRDFFELFLPEETDRYVFRIAAIKEIVGNPKKYGLPLEKSDYYRPYAVTEVVLELDKETHTAVLAQAMDLPYKIFREYNLHIRKYRLPRGVYRLYVPVEKKETFFRGSRIAPASPSGTASSLPEAPLMMNKTSTPFSTDRSFAMENDIFVAQPSRPIEFP